MPMVGGGATAPLLPNRAACPDFERREDTVKRRSNTSVAGPARLQAAQAR
jgi:hypothetical protein